MRYIYKSEQSGRSMVEMLGVLAIVGVLSVGGIAGYSKAMAKFKNTKVMDQASMLIASTRMAYNGQTNFSGLTTVVAWDMGVASPEMMIEPVAGTRVLANVFAPTASSVFVNAATSAATPPVANGAMGVTFAMLPKDACTSLATTDWGRGSGFVGVIVETMATPSATTASGNVPGATANTAAGFGIDNLPAAPALAAQGCAGDLDNAVTLFFEP